MEDSGRQTWSSYESIFNFGTSSVWKYSELTFKDLAFENDKYIMVVAKMKQAIQTKADALRMVVISVLLEIDKVMPDLYFLSSRFLFCCETMGGVGSDPMIERRLGCLV